MLRVLRRAGRPLTADDISAAIGRYDLYIRHDGEYPPASQISARARKQEYRHFFDAKGDPLRYSPAD